FDLSEIYWPLCFRFNGCLLVMWLLLAGAIVGISISSEFSVLLHCLWSIGNMYSKSMSYLRIKNFIFNLKK
ncbi:hypothetical protein ALC56_12346, partial [Trachymyrmex septentrionalis]